MGIIKDQYEKTGRKFLSNFLIGAIESVIESEFRDKKEKIEEIEKLIKEYKEVIKLKDEDDKKYIIKNNEEQFIIKSEDTVEYRI